MNNSILFLTENLHYIEKLEEQLNKNFAFHFLNYDKFYLLNKAINTFPDFLIFTKNPIFLKVISLIKGLYRL